MGSWLAVFTLAVSALWAVPAGAEEDSASQESCEAELAACMDWANSEPVDWIRDYKMDWCNSLYETCVGPQVCGDGICNSNSGEDSYSYCAEDCG